MTIRERLALLLCGDVEPPAHAPLQIRSFRLEHPSVPDRAWLRRTLDHDCRPFGSRIALSDDAWTIEWSGPGCIAVMVCREKRPNSPFSVPRAASLFTP